jgi:hypothetical protein
LAHGTVALLALFGTRLLRTHPFAPDARQRPGKTPVRTALSPRYLIRMRALVQVSQAHYTPLDLRKRSSVVSSIAVASAGRRRAAVSERIPALLSSDDYGSSVERHGGCHPVYANVRGRQLSGAGLVKRVNKDGW